MVISILGCGWYGKALAKSLVKKNITVKGSATSAEKLEQLRVDGISPYQVRFDVDGESFDPEFFRCDVLVIAITPKFRKGETDGYLPKIKRIIDVIEQSQIEKVIYISSTGVYGDHNSEVSESDFPKPDTASGAILWEAEKLFQRETTFTTTIIRFAGLVGPGRNPGRFFAGKKDIPNGMAPVNLIHLKDCVGIGMAIIEQDAFGYLFNACAPDHPAKEDFYRDAAAKAGLPLPEFIHELRSHKIIISNNLNNILNYRFQVTNWVACKF
ncbi:MAG TPA: SDR family oxidoreductase [Mucilaginibacter sp.]|jgi:nucleoside-diphosphate-sugar epimerase